MEKRTVEKKSFLESLDTECVGGPTICAWCWRSYPLRMVLVALTFVLDAGDPILFVVLSVPLFPLCPYPS